MREDWISGLSDDINQCSCSAVFHPLQAPSTHSVMTRFQLTPRSNSFSRSLVDSSYPNPQTPCWGTVERYKHAKTHTHCCTIILENSETCSQQKYIQCHKIKYISFFYCLFSSIRLLIHSLKWRSSVCQSIAARNRHELLMTTVRYTDQPEIHPNTVNSLNHWSMF